jgi:hypothetical protein
MVSFTTVLAASTLAFAVAAAPAASTANLPRLSMLRRFGTGKDTRPINIVAADRERIEHVRTQAAAYGKAVQFPHQKVPAFVDAHQSKDDARAAVSVPVNNTAVGIFHEEPVLSADFE